MTAHYSDCSCPSCECVRLRAERDAAHVAFSHMVGQRDKAIAERDQAIARAELAERELGALREAARALLEAASAAVLEVDCQAEKEYDAATWTLNKALRGSKP